MIFRPRQKWAWIGCDPGLDGGIAALRSDAAPLVMKMPLQNRSGMQVPSVPAIHDLLGALFTAEYKVTVASEEPFLLRGQKGNLTMGTRWGVLLGAFYGRDLDVEVVGPKTWQKYLFDDVPPELHVEPNPDPKVRAAEFVAREYPDVCLRASKKCMKDHDGIIDALCVATWWRRQCGG